MAKGCCCWNDLSTAVTASATFTLVTSLMQLFVQGAVWAGNADIALEAIRTINALFVGLAVMDFLVVIVSIVLLSVVEKGARKRGSMMPWIIVVILYMLYEAALNLLFLVNWMMALDQGVMYIISYANIGYVVVPMIYWVFKLMFLIAAVVTVVSYYRSHDDWSALRRSYMPKGLGADVGIVSDKHSGGGMTFGRMQPYDYSQYYNSFTYDPALAYRY